MKTSKYLTHTGLLEQIDRINRGDATRAQAAEALGWSVATLNLRLARTGLNKGLRDLRKEAADHLWKPNPDTVEDYAKAIEMAKNSRSVASVHKKFPHLNYVYLCRRVKNARQREELCES